MPLHGYGVDARWLKLVPQTDERIVISSCQTVRNEKNDFQCNKTYKKEKPFLSFSAKIVLVMTYTLVPLSYERRPLSSQKRYHFTDVRMRHVLSYGHFCCSSRLPVKSHSNKWPVRTGHILWGHTVQNYSSQTRFTLLWLFVSTFPRLFRSVYCYDELCWIIKIAVYLNKRGHWAVLFIWTILVPSSCMTIISVLLEVSSRYILSEYWLKGWFQLIFIIRSSSILEFSILSRKNTG